MCDDEFLLDMIRTCPYFGSLLGFIVFSFISDNLGRKITMSVSLGLTTLGSIMVVLGFNLSMISIGVIMSGAGINVASAITFCYLGEIVENYKRQKYSILVQMSYTFGAMILTGASNFWDLTKIFDPSICHSI
jgi:MFS family permease